MAETLANAHKKHTGMLGGLASLQSRISPLAELPPNLPNIQFPSKEEVEGYKSSSILMREIAREAQEWKDYCPEGSYPAVVAILSGGLQIDVDSLSKISFDGIRVKGFLNGEPCSLLSHQSTIQLLCVFHEISEENPKRPIGFIWDDQNITVNEDCT